MPAGTGSSAPRAGPPPIRTWLRNTAAAATASAPRVMAPFMTSAAGVPHSPPTPPVSPFPIGVEPEKTVV